MNSSLGKAFELLVVVAVSWALASSAAFHLRNPYYFLGAILRYRLCNPIVAKTIAAALPFLQIAIVACLVSRIYYLSALLLAALVFVVFSTVQMTAVMRGLDISCGCFKENTPVDLWSIALTGTLSALVLLIYIRHYRSNAFIQHT